MGESSPSFSFNPLFERKNKKKKETHLWAAQVLKIHRLASSAELEILQKKKN